MTDLQYFAAKATRLGQDALAPFQEGRAVQEDVDRLRAACSWFAKAESEVAEFSSRVRLRMTAMQSTLSRSAISGPSAEPFLLFERDAEAAADSIEQFLSGFRSTKRALDACLASVRPKAASR